MKLAFLSNKILNPVSGGQIYNEALLEAAELSGFEVLRWEGYCFGELRKSVLFMNVVFLIKTIFVSPKTIFVYDTDYHARYLISLFWARYIRRAKCIGMLHLYNYLSKNNPLIREIQKKIEQITSIQFSSLIVNTPYSYSCFKLLTNKQVVHEFLEPYMNTPKIRNKCSAKFEVKYPVRILSVGTIEYRKNFDQIINACHLLKLPFLLTIVGETSDFVYRKQLEYDIEKFNLQGRVVFVGKKNKDELADYYENSDLFLLPSRLESYGMVYAEAMRFGLPIVAAKAGAVPDLVLDGINGILCDPENPSQIADAVTTICELENFVRFSENNIKRAEALVTREQFIENAKVVLARLNNFK